MVDYVSSGLDKWLASEAENVDTENDIGYIVKKEAVKLIKQSYIEPVINEIKNSASNVSASIDEVSNTLNSIISRIRVSISGTIKSGCESVKTYKKKMLDDVKASMNEGAGKLKETLNSKLDGIFGQSQGNDAATDNTGIASLLSFGYSDYLRLFLMIGLYTNEEGILLRTADVIQVNMSKQTGNENFALSNSAVYVDISATIYK